MEVLGVWWRFRIFNVLFTRPAPSPAKQKRGREPGENHEAV